jgi:hypothetical protein
MGLNSNAGAKCLDSISRERSAPAITAVHIIAVHNLTRCPREANWGI